MCSVVSGVCRLFRVVFLGLAMCAGLLGIHHKSAYAGETCYSIGSGPPTEHCVAGHGYGVAAAQAKAHSLALWGFAPTTCEPTGNYYGFVGANCEFRANFACTDPSANARGCGSVAYTRCASGEMRTATGCAKYHNIEGSCAANPTTAHPINLGSASKVNRGVDFSTGGTIPFTLERAHNSNPQYSKMANGSPPVAFFPMIDYSRFGRAWRSQYDTRVFKFSTNYLHFAMPSGRELVFRLSYGVWKPAYPLANTNYYIWFAGRKGINMTAEVVGAEVLLTDQHNLVRVYDINDGRLKELRYRGGYVQTLTYTGDFNTSISDNLGRTMSFTYDSNGYAQTMTAPDGTVHKYIYTDAYPGSSDLVDELKLTEVVHPDATPATDTDNPRTVYHYENPDYRIALTGITDERGVRFATYTYDTDGRAIASQHAGGADSYTVAYDDTSTSAPKSTVTNTLGKDTIYHFGKYQGIKRITSIEGVSSANCVASNETVTYDSNNYINQRTDAEGRITKNTNNTRGLPTQIIEGFGTPEARTTTNTWHADFNLPTQIAEPGRTTDLVYDAQGRVTSRTETDITTHSLPYVTAGQTRTWTYSYTTAGLLLSVDGPLPGNGDTQSWTYDANGYVATSTNELGHVTTVVSVNGRGLPLTVRDANAIDTAMTYDERGRLLTVTRAAGTGAQATTTLEYDDHGQITRITRPDGSWLAYTYNDARRLTEIADKLGDKITYTYDLMGNVTQTQRRFAAGTLSYTVSKTYDELGRVLSSIGVSSATTSYAWDRTHNLAALTDPRSGVYSYGYDALARLVSATDQDTDVVTYGLDGQDELTSYPDPKNLATTYVRNGFGETIQETSPDTGTTTYVRDARGLVTQATDARSVVTDYTYDGAGRMLTKSFPASPGENVTYSWDSMAGGNHGKGRLTSFNDASGSTARAYDARGNVTLDTRSIGLNSYQVAYAYNAADQVSQIMYPSGRVVIYARGDTGHVIDVTTAASLGGPVVDIATTIVRFPHSGIVRSFDYGSGLSQLTTLDLDHAVNTLSVLDGAAAIFERTHTRSDKFNLTGITDTLTPADNQTFTYDADGDLRSATGPWGTLNFTHDAVGNRANRALTLGGSTATETYTYPASSNLIGSVDLGGMITRTFTHDASGNMAQDLRGADLYAFTYNHTGRMASASRNGGLEATYTYTADEQLAVRDIVGANPVHYVHDRQGNVLAEIDGTTGTTLREYIWLPDDEIAPTRETSGTPVARPLAVVDTSAGTTTLHMVHVDHLNRPVMMTDTGKLEVWAATYLPFGAVHALTGPATLDARLPGQWFQLETDLAYNWHRQYDPTIGRYTQADPLGFPDGPSRYAYAMNSPQMYVDKDGRITLTPDLAPGMDDLWKKLKEKIFPTVCYAPQYKRESGVPPLGSGDPLDRCLNAAEGGTDSWDQFCNTVSSKERGNVAGNDSARRACRDKTYESEQQKKNWCYNQYGS